MCMTAMGGVGRDEFEEDVDSSMENRALYESGSNADPLSHFMRGEVDHFRACPAGVSDGLPDDLERSRRSRRRKKKEQGESVIVGADEENDQRKPNN